MCKKYQVFVSSTFEDLKEERAEVVKGILEMGCIPCGMEYFPAANTDSWTYIEKLIEQCDYYVVIVAGKYGSTTAEGISYTQKEYQCAVDNGVPVLAFVHSNPAKLSENQVERDPVRSEKLKEFTTLVERRLCKLWETKDQLKPAVIASLHQLMMDVPRPGWVRADGKTKAEELSMHVVRSPQVEIELLSGYRVVKGGPLLSFDVQTANPYIRNALRSVMMNLSLKNLSADGLKDVKCEMFVKSDMDVVVSMKIPISEDLIPRQNEHIVIDPVHAADVQLRPGERRERFASFFIRPENGGKVEWTITVLNSLKPLTAKKTTEILCIKVPLSSLAEHMIERVWDDAKGLPKMISFLIKTAEKSTSVNDVKWGNVFSDFIESEWRRWYDKQ